LLPLSTLPLLRKLPPSLLRTLPPSLLRALPERLVNTLPASVLLSRRALLLRELSDGAAEAGRR
jgi:hypothetical protein